MLSLIHSFVSLTDGLRRLFYPHRIKNPAKPSDFATVYAFPTAFQSWPVGVTEVIASGEQELVALMPFLAGMTRQRKWIVLVSPPYIPQMARLIQAGIDPARFMIVRARSNEGKSWAVQQALRSHDCGAVLFWSQPLEPRRRISLEVAAIEGKCSCISFIEHCNTLIKTEKAA
ncbi:MAG: hypothetical protein KGK17_06760 [Betaproteobacteria bacterium]|nr:hypothetical protein [Betaproteobacteria bacterium]